MNNKDPSAEQDEHSSIEVSLQLELMAAMIGIIAQALSILAILEAIEEAKVTFEKDKQDKNKFDEQFNHLQLQIDQLTAELAEIKLTNQ